MWTFVWHHLIFCQSMYTIHSCVTSPNTTGCCAFPAKSWFWYVTTITGAIGCPTHCSPTASLLLVPAYRLTLMAVITSRLFSSYPPHDLTQVFNSAVLGTYVCYPTCSLMPKQTACVIKEMSLHVFIGLGLRHLSSTAKWTVYCCRGWY